MNAETGESTPFGRVDPDGTVHVRTAQGERVVGQWQAGTPAEGLAHYERRYADLVTEVRLLESRMAGGAAEPQATLRSVQRLRDGLDTAAVVGDLDAVAARLDALLILVEKRSEEQRAARAEAREHAAERKRVLVAEAEQIGADGTNWKTAGDRLRDILEEWKTIKGVDKRTDAELWKRYAAARDAFGRRRSTHFAGLDAGRKEARAAKELLVTEAEALSASTEWVPTANRFKQLMSQWRTLGRAQREAEETLWNRFRAAQDAFFVRRQEVFAQRDAELVVNQRAKEEMLAEAEAMDVSDPKAAQARLRDLQARWDAAGHVPRDAMGPLDRRLRAVEDRIRDATETAWRRSAPSDNPLLTQMRQQVAEAEQRLERARAAGDARRVTDAEAALASKRRFLDLAEGAR